MKQSFLLTALLISCNAYATNYLQPGNTDIDINQHLKQHQNQNQQQLQMSKQIQTSNSSSVSGSDASAIATGTGGSNTSNTNLDGGDNNILFLPTHTVPVPTSVVPGTQSIQTTSGCGIRQEIVKEEVTGKYFNLISSPTDIKLGHTDSLKPSEEMFKEVTKGTDKYLIGHEVIITTTPLAISGARQFGLGGNGNSGGGGSGSIGASGSLSQVVSNIILRDCIYAKTDTTPKPIPVVETPVVTPVPASCFTKPVYKKKKHVNTCSVLKAR